MQATTFSKELGLNVKVFTEYYIQELKKSNFATALLITRQNMSLHLSAQTTRSKLVVKDRTVSVKRS